MEQRLKEEIHDMSEKIYELQQKTEHLTNGQRYAAINEIEKSIAPLRSDLHHLERTLYQQKTVDLEISNEIDKILVQISDLENLKSDLTKKINTENEHTRKFYHNEVMQFMREEITPLREDIATNKGEINEVKEMIKDLKNEIEISEKNRELKDAEKFDRFKWVITGVVGLITAFSALALWLEPAIQILLHIFFGL